MIVEERMTAYLDSLDTGNSEFLETLEQQAKSDGVPIVRRHTERDAELSEGAAADEAPGAHPGGGHGDRIFRDSDVREYAAGDDGHND